MMSFRITVMSIVIAAILIFVLVRLSDAISISYIGWRDHGRKVGLIAEYIFTIACAIGILRIRITTWYVRRQTKLIRKELEQLQAKMREIR